MKTRFAYLEKDHVAKVGEREIPDELGPHEVLLHMLGNNLCTTDYQHWMGLREHQGYPMAGGHEGESIVEKVGYSENSYFSRIFKKYYGITPGDYRKKNRRY